MSNSDKSKLAMSELLVINQLNTMVCEGFSKKIILNSAVKFIRELFEFNNCAIYCLGNDKKHLILQSFDINDKVLKTFQSAYKSLLKLPSLNMKGMKIPLYEGSTFKEVIDNREPMVVTSARGLMDYTEDTKLHKKAEMFSKILGSRDVVRVPLVVDNQVFGVLGAARKEELANKDISFLVDIATHIALIIRKHISEKKVLASELKYRSLFRSAGDPIMVVDKTRKIIEFNDKACETYGYNFQEMIGKDIRSFDVMMTKEEIKQKDIDIIKYGDVVFETKHKKKNGKIMDVLVTGTVIPTDGSKTVQFISKDITKMKELVVYQEREKHLLLYMDAMDLAALPIVLWHLGEIVFANKKMTSLTGFTHDELKGMSLRNLIVEKDRKYFDGLCKVLFGHEVGTAFAGELTIQNKQGEKKYVTLNQVKTDMGNGDPIFSTTIVDQNYTNKKLEDIDILLNDINDEVEGMNCDT